MQIEKMCLPKASVLWTAVLLALLALAVPIAASAAALESFILQCDPRCDAVAAAVSQIPGARITQVYQNVPGLAITLPVAAVPTVQGRSDVVGMIKDAMVSLPPPDSAQGLMDPTGRQVVSTAQLPGFIAARPADYSFNNDLIGATALQSQGFLGDGVVVAVIDSGTANNPSVVPALAGSVIGGESFVPGDTVTSATSTLNGAHGTWVGTVIAGHAIFLFPNSSTLIQSLQAHAPASVIPCSQLGCPSTLSGVPMIGVAPAASLYALKIFASNSENTTSSRILAAMDRAITLRRNFNNGVPSTPTNPGCGGEDNPCVYDSLPIQILNMSLSGPTLFAGHDLEAQLTLEMLNVGITIAAAAGNSGPSALTIGTPGSGFGALTVGAAATAAHERVLHDLQFGLGIGNLFRPFSGLQSAAFSSRGPDPDGRFGIDVSANGMGTFVEGADGSISLVSGTSFSAPIVAGAATLLRQEFPTASATQIRNALAVSGNPNAFADGSGRIDRGSGLLDIPAAAARLASGDVSSTVPVGPSLPSIALNLLPLGITPVVFSGNTFTTQLNNLKPGQTVQFYVPTQDNTDDLKVSIQNVTPALPPAQQNQLFGDNVFVNVIDAFTSFAFPRAYDFVVADSTLDIPLPQSGLVRVSVQGTPSNAGTISCKVVIQRHNAQLIPPTKVGKIVQGQDTLVRVQVPPGTAQLSFFMSWMLEWGNYPTNDIDLVLEDPNGQTILNGATANTPERVNIADPAPGVWTAHIQGFQINRLFDVLDSDLWTLRVSADGHRLSPLP
ncbi:MAG TPA: S8 family serine peptidase [Thermoanaerobaculia bacterium]|nr:S8 family serine peptidase [Thermoanaerobaculia bacterium]